MKNKVTVFICGLLFMAAKPNAQIISTIAGTGTSGFNGDSIAATAAELFYPQDIASDYAGNVYVTDFENNRIRKIDHSSGIITTVAGNGTGGNIANGIPATSAEIELPCGIAVDSAGNIYIAGYINHCIYMVTQSTGIIYTIAGTGTGGYNGDGIAATTAELDDPEGVSLDDSDNIYIADTYNYRIRKISAATGIITTIAGNGTDSYSGDRGQATAAEIGHTEKVKSDREGNIYIPDEDNYRVRYADVLTGVITTVAGNGIASFSGDGGLATAAELGAPEGVTLDGAGNFYVADLDEQRIRMVTLSTGIITTVVGNGVAGFFGDGGQATAAEINGPVGVSFDYSGNLFIGDAGNNRVRKVTGEFVTGVVPEIVNEEGVIVYPNPSTGKFDIMLAKGNGTCLLEVYNLTGEKIYAGKLFSTDAEIDLGSPAQGIYLYRILTESGNFVKQGKIVIEQ